MSLNRRISWTAATRAKLPAGFLSARAMIECYVKTRRPLGVAGKFDRAAIMAHAVVAAKAARFLLRPRTGCRPMKTRITMRAALALGLPAVARGVGRLRRLRSDFLNHARHEARRGNVMTASVLVALYVVAL